MKETGEVVEEEDEEEVEVEDSIVSGFVGAGRRSKCDVTRRPFLNTVSEQEGSDLESLASTLAGNSKVSNSCDFCGTVYDDAKGLRRHMKAKHR